MSPIRVVPTDKWDAIDEFYSFFKYILGAFLDLDSALGQLRKMEEINRADFNTDHGITEADLDKAWQIYGEGDSITTTNPPLSLTSRRAFRFRISKGGPDEMIIGHMCLVAIFHAWEDHFRGLIAKEIGVNKGDLKYEVIGDLRSIRRSIIHRQGRAQRSLDWLSISRGVEIIMDIERWKIFDQRLRLMCRDLKRRKYGTEEDPKWRFV